MRKLLLLILTLAVSQEALFSQSSNYNDTVFGVNTIFFYGYDLTKIRLAEPKRIGEKHISTLYSWENYCMEKISNNRMQRWFQKDTIVFRTNVALKLFSSVESDNIVGAVKKRIKEEQLTQVVRGYDIKEAKGVGLVIIPEYLEKSTKETSSYYVFFDINSREILIKQKVVSKEVDGYGLTEYWGNGLVYNFKVFIDKFYLKGLKKYKKN